MDSTTQRNVDVDQATETCDRCQRSLERVPAFDFKGRAPGGQPDTASGVTKCIYCAFQHGPMLKRSLKAAIVVGTVLTALNQGDVLLAGDLSNALYWKIPLTYCVPFLVATYGALINNRK